jgi:hypothetical protein
MTDHNDQWEAEKLREYRRGMRDVYREQELAARNLRQFYDRLLGIAPKPEDKE